ARLRPGRRRALRRRLQPPGLGPPHALPARQGLQRQGAAPLRPLPGGPPRPHRPLPRPADVADPRHRRGRRRLRRPQALRGGQRAQVPQHPRDRDLQEVPGPLRHRPGGAGHREGVPRRGRPGVHRPPGPASRAVVVEGYTDVMACHLAGVTTAIATCGTAFGGDHIKILRRLLMDNGSARVIFTFDGDAAGQKAALRAFEDDQKFAAETYIAIAPDGMDPCDLRLAKGDDAVADLAEPRTPLFEFALRQIVGRYDLDTPAGRAAALDEAAPVVARIKN